MRARTCTQQCETRPLSKTTERATRRWHICAPVQHYTIAANCTICSELYNLDTATTALYNCSELYICSQLCHCGELYIRAPCQSDHSTAQWQRTVQYRYTGIRRRRNPKFNLEAAHMAHDISIKNKTENAGIKKAREAVLSTATARIHAYTHTRTNTHTHIYIYAHMHTRTHTHTHTSNTQTNTHRQATYTSTPTHPHTQVVSYVKGGEGGNWHQRPEACPA